MKEFILKQSLIWVIVFFTGCAVVTMQTVPKPDVKKLDSETRQNAENILKNIRKTALNHDLEYLGRNTMVEAVKLIDMGPLVAGVLLGKLKVAENWKFRFWIVDILGYIPNRDSIIPLIEVIEDNTEEEKIRLRACESLKELRYTTTLEHLLISNDIVEDQKVKNKITETIKALR